MTDARLRDAYLSPRPHEQVVRVPAALRAEARAFIQFLQRVGRRHPRPLRLTYRYLGRGRFHLALIGGGSDGVDGLLQELILNRGLFYYCCTLTGKAQVVDGVILPIFRSLIDERFQNAQSRFLRKHVLGKHAQTDFVPTDMRTPQGARVDILSRRWELGAINTKEYVIELDAVLTEFLLIRGRHVPGQRSPKFGILLKTVGPTMAIDPDLQVTFREVHELSRATLHRLENRATGEQLQGVSGRLWNYFQYVDEFDDSQRERTVVLRSKRYKRIRYGDEQVGDEIEQMLRTENGMTYVEWAARGPCGDCGVQKGQLHVDGCDLEFCPRCGGQCLGCDCAVSIQQLTAWKRHRKGLQKGNIP